MSRDDAGQPRRAAPRLGPLEMAVLDVLWADGRQNVSDMHRKVGDPRGLSRNTTQSTLERLVRKRLAARRRVGRAYEYRALLSRSDWIARSLAAVIDSVPGNDPAQLLAGFVEATERVGADQLAALERIVRERRTILDRARGEAPTRDGASGTKAESMTTPGRRRGAEARPAERPEPKEPKR